RSSDLGAPGPRRSAGHRGAAADPRATRRAATPDPPLRLEPPGRDRGRLERPSGAGGGRVRAPRGRRDYTGAARARGAGPDARGPREGLAVRPVRAAVAPAAVARSSRGADPGRGGILALPLRRPAPLGGARDHRGTLE